MEVTLVAPEGPIVGVVAICQHLLKDTPLVANCTYLEKSQVDTHSVGCNCRRSTLLLAESSSLSLPEVSRMLLITLPMKLRLYMLR